MNFLFYIFLTITLIFNFTNAKELKVSKNTNKTMSDEEFMKQWEQLEKEKKEAKALIKTIDEITRKLGIDKKTQATKGEK